MFFPSPPYAEGPWYSLSTFTSFIHQVHGSGLCEIANIGEIHADKRENRTMKMCQKLRQGNKPCSSLWHEWYRQGEHTDKFDHHFVYD